MRAALAEARKGTGLTSPNPAVGAVLVSKGKILARAFHGGPGTPHAEAACLARAKGRLPADATLYVTLEPCSSTGRTPPCTGTIIAAGVQRVVFAGTDPNPRHSGRARALLEAGGLEVRDGVLADDATALNPGFNKWIRTGLPHVTLKCGMSLDGRLTRAPGESRWLTGAAARRQARRERGRFDAILVGAGTVRKDDPRLTLATAGRQPWRVVLTRSGKLPPAARLLTDSHRERTIVLRGLTLRAALSELGRREITSVLIEGGGEILSQALEEKLADRVRIYLAPLLTGGPVLAFGGRGAATTAEGVRLVAPDFERIGSDVCVTAEWPGAGEVSVSS